MYKFRKSTKVESPGEVPARSSQNPVPEGPLPSTNAGASGYDVLLRLGTWLRSVAKWVLLAAAMVLSAIFIGWYAAASLVFGLVLWWFLLDRFLNDSGAVLLDECKDGIWTTWSIGQDAWAAMKVNGIPFAFRTSSGQPRYLAEEFDYEQRKITYAWIHEVSSWKFFMTFRAHKSLLKILEKVLPENNKLRIYPRLLGYRETKENQQVIHDILDGDLLQAKIDSGLWIKRRENIDSFFDWGLDEIIEDPDKEDRTGTEVKKESE